MNEFRAFGVFGIMRFRRSVGKPIYYYRVFARCVIENFSTPCRSYSDAKLIQEKNKIIDNRSSHSAKSGPSSGGNEQLEMSKVEAYQLSHPELLSEETLCEILKNSCIVLPTFKTLGKEELIEIFKRIALPLPQRRYNEARILGKSLNDLRVKRGINAATYHSENKDIPTAISLTTVNKNQREDTEDHSAKNRLKPPISKKQQITKKIRLSNSCQMEDLAEKDAKRKSEVSSHPDSKKRQKITWP